MHNALPAALGRATGQGEKPPFCLQPGAARDSQCWASAGEPESRRRTEGQQDGAAAGRGHGQKWHSGL